MKGAILEVSKVTRGRKQVSREDDDASRKLALMRIHVEELLAK